MKLGCNNASRPRLCVLPDSNAVPFQRDVHGGNRRRKNDARHRRLRQHPGVSRSLRKSRRQRRDSHWKHFQFDDSTIRPWR
jgi:hypothetical protein